MGVVVSVVTLVIQAEEFLEKKLGRFKPIIKASMRMDENHSQIVVKLNTLRAIRDDLKNKATKYQPRKEKSTVDWFHRVMIVEKEAEELKDMFRKKQKYLRTMNFVQRLKLSKRMVNMRSKLSQLVMEGNTLWYEFEDERR